MTVNNVSSGQRITAETFNSIANPVRGMQKIRGGDGANVTMGPGGVGITLSSDLSTRRDAFIAAASNVGALGINPYRPAVVTGQLHGPSQVYGEVALQIDNPASGDTDERWVITADAIAAGRIGRVCVMGVCLCYVQGETGDENQPRAALDTDFSTTALRLAASGSAEVLWRDPTADVTTEHLALVRWPSGGGGGVTIETHATFPAIPSVPTLISCKGQMWYAESGYTVWRACVMGTTATGVVGT